MNNVTAGPPSAPSGWESLPGPWVAAAEPGPSKLENVHRPIR